MQYAQWLIGDNFFQSRSALIAPSNRPTHPQSVRRLQKHTRRNPAYVRDQQVAAYRQKRTVRRQSADRLPLLQIQPTDAHLILVSTDKKHLQDQLSHGGLPPALAQLVQLDQETQSANQPIQPIVKNALSQQHGHIHQVLPKQLFS